MSIALAEGVSRRELWAWAMYDFANSGYTTVVITAVFNAYFVGVVANDAAWATFAWTAALSLSYIVMIVTAPLLGAFADAHAAKKKVLAATTVGCVVFTAALASVGKGEVALGVTLIVLSNFFFGSGEAIVAAFLPELARRDAMGRVSGWGWSLGYLGGLLSLGLTLLYVNWAQRHGHGAAQFVPVSMLITAALFALASLPTFLYLKERAQPIEGTGHAVRAAFERLLSTARRAGHYRDFGRFLACGVFYQAGIAAVISLAAIYADQAMHFKTSDTLLLIFVVNITAAVGAFGFGHVQDRIGHKAAVALTLLGWIAMTLIAYAAQGAPAFWVAANIAGLCMGSSQSAGRALVGLLAPRERSGEFFGLWAVATRLSAVFGPLTYGVATWLSGGDHRLAMLITGGYFIVGLALLASINVERGVAAAEQ